MNRDLDSSRHRSVQNSKNIDVFYEARDSTSLALFQLPECELNIFCIKTALILSCTFKHFFNRSHAIVNAAECKKLHSLK